MATKKKTGSRTDENTQIIQAVIKDDFCNYDFEVVEGLGLGDKHSVKGKGIIRDSLRTAFGQLGVHLACVDDVFKHANVDIKDITKMRGHELAVLYNITGFKFKGGEEDPSVVLMGTKYVTQAGGRIELETPRIAVDKLSSYPWWKDLSKCIEEAKEEVQRYRAGHYDPVEPKEVKDKNQMTIGDIAEDFHNNMPEGLDVSVSVGGGKFKKLTGKKTEAVTGEEEPGVDFESGKIK